MPKFKVRLRCTSEERGGSHMLTTYIVEAPTALSVMAKFSAAADSMPYTGPVTDEPPAHPGDSDA